MPLTSGELFAGYRILAMIGSGGMGEVYLAQHPRLPRQDALKVLPAHMSGDGDFRDRFSREADLAATLFHPHIVGVHDRGEHRGQLWISMDYIDGTDAGRLVHQQYPAGMPVGDVIEIAAAIAEALDYAHAGGLLHRDVKPGNILLAKPVAGRRRILLADFGIARSMADTSTLTRTNMALGTVHYASPEQLRNQVLDGRTDQYSLAATTFELLTGRPPFHDPSPAVVMSHHLSAPPPSLAAFRPELSALDVPFAVALSKHRGDRFRTCLEFVESLQAHVQRTRWMPPPPPTGTAAPVAHPPMAPAGMPRSRMAQPARNHALLWPLSIAAVVAITVVSALIYYSQSRQDGTATSALPPPTTAQTTTETTETTRNSASTTSFDAMRQFVTSYYAELPEDTDTAWTKLSSSYQAQTGGKKEYEKFWKSMRSVSVDSVTQRDDDSVTARLTYVMRNGTTNTEQRWFELAPSDGQLLITNSAIGS